MLNVNGHIDNPPPEKILYETLIYSEHNYFASISFVDNTTRNSFQQFPSQLQHLQHEYKETVEFSDAERQILQEAHIELEAEVCGVFI